MDDNDQELEVMVESHPPTTDLNIPRGFRYSANTILPVIQLVYITGASYFLAENLEDSRALQVTLPLVFGGIVVGAFVIRDAYSRAANGLARILYSNSMQTD